MNLPAFNIRALFPFLRWWPMVNRHTLRDDLVAGATGALVVLPQGVAFATIAGLPPEYGLYAAMVPTVIAALFGSSLHLVSGPTTAISVAIFAVLATQYEPGSAQYISMVLTLTFLAGVFQLALGLARMGALVNFISHSVVVGFTAGAALLIMASQVRNFFGIEIVRGASLVEILRQLFLQIGSVHWPVLCISLVTLATGIFTKRCWPKVPFMVVAMIAGSLVASLLNVWLGPAVTGIRTVGALPARLPPLSHPDLSFASLQFAVGPALVIAMLGLTEAVSIARAIIRDAYAPEDGMRAMVRASSWLSLTPLLAPIIGGLGTVFGPVIGALGLHAQLDLAARDAGDVEQVVDELEADAQVVAVGLQRHRARRLHRRRCPGG